MIYKLRAGQVDQLLSLPETGMGYQIIKARQDGEYVDKNFIVLNADVMVMRDKMETFELRRLTEAFDSVKSKQIISPYLTFVYYQKNNFQKL